jgi:hypothetical protein
MQINKQQNSKSKSGFAVLFAILLASFLITLGISIFSISLKEVQIATSIRDSQVAYYIADSARECAIYWDVREGAFPACLNSSCSTDPSKIGIEVSTTTSPTIFCNGNPIHLNFAQNLTNLSFSDNQLGFFQASSTSSSTPIADLSILKKLNADSRITTTITALGHNTGIIGRRVERGIKQVNNQ